MVFPVAAAWLGLNFIWDILCRATGGSDEKAWFMQPMRVGEGRYLTFLLLMSGFWTSFNQIFMTLPEYSRDYIDTSDLISAFGIGSSAASRAWLEHGQIKPEYLINLNAFGIIVGQVAISYLSRKLPALTTILSGLSASRLPI